MVILDDFHRMRCASFPHFTALSRSDQAKNCAMTQQRLGVTACDARGWIVYSSDYYGGFSDQTHMRRPLWTGCADPVEVQSSFAKCLGTQRPVENSAVAEAPDGQQYRFRSSLHPMPRDIAVVCVYHPPRVGEPLEPREIEALRLMSEGESLEQMGVSKRTVSQIVSSARDKLGARHTTHAVALAVRHGLI